MSLFVVIATAVLGGFISVRDGKVAQKQTLIAKGYLDQAVEALRSVREKGWEFIISDCSTSCYPNLSGSSWELLAGTGPAVDGFRTRIVVSDVKRDVSVPSGDVSVSGGLDLASKKATLTVFWGALPRQSIFTTVFLTRREPNANFEHNLCGDFDDGATAGTFVQYEDEQECKDGDEAKDGEIVLAPGGYGNWCNPTGPSVTTVDLNRQGVPTTVWAFRAEKDGTKFNEVFAGTGGNASGTPFTNTKIKGNSPPAASRLGDYQMNPKQKANSVFGTADYAYVATDKQSTAMMILDLHQFTDSPTNSLYKRVGAFDSSDSNNANSVYVVGDTAYLTTTKLYIVDVTTKSSPSKISSFPLDGVGTKVVVLDGTAYVGISGSSTKLELIDVNPAHAGTPKLLGRVVDSNLASVRDVYVRSDGKRAYIVTDLSASKPEFFIVDTHVPESPILLESGAFETSINAKGVVVVASDTIAIVVGTNGSDTHPEYQVLDISTESEVKYCTKGGTGKMRVPSGAHAISTVYQEDDGHAYSYIVTGDTNAELKIVEGGTGGMGGGGGYSGYYESEPITPFTKDVEFNRFDTSADPQGGEVRLWVAAYEPEVGSCSLSGTYPYVGPDGTAGTFFGSAGSVPFSSGVAGYVNPAKCFRYKLQLISGTPGTSPVFDWIKVNYSP
jgi:hypothetical protein